MSETISHGIFIDRYVAYAKTLTDAPADLHVLAGKTILSKVIGRKAYIQFSYGRMYLNLYCMGIARPSSRKTTVYTICNNILRRVGLEEVILPAKCTPEQLMRKLGRDSDRLYTNDEYSVFLIDSTKNYNSGLINDMVALYDSPPVYTVGRVGEHQDSDEGDIIIRKPHLNKLVFMQPDTYVEHMTSYMFGLGFPQRFEYIFADPSEHVSRPRLTRSLVNEEERDRIVDMLKLVKSSINDYTEVIFSPELHELIHKEIELKYEVLWSDNPLINTFPSRLADQTYKNSALMAIQRACLSDVLSIPFTTVEVEKRDVEIVIDYMNSKVIHSLLSLVMRTVGSSGYNDYIKTMMKIEDIIERHGKEGEISHSALLRFGHFDADTLSKHIRQAVLEEKMAEFFKKETGRTRWYALIK